MKLFHSRIELSVWVALFIYFIHILSFNWWDALFLDLSSNKNSLRFFQIWVQADQKDAPWIRPIGGSEKLFDYWSRFIQAALYQAQRYPNVDFQIELILDEKTHYYHHDFLKNLSETYPHHLKISFYDRFVNNLQPDSSHTIISQCVSGIAACCSDIVRAQSLYNQMFDYNVYLDIDTFVHRIKNRKNPFLVISPHSLNSQQVFGTIAKKEGFYQGTAHSFAPGIDGHSFKINNDFLMSYRPDPQEADFIKDLSLNNVKKYEYFLQAIALRPSVEVSFYQDFFHSRINYMIQNPDLEFLPSSTVILCAGPAFWKDLYLQGWSEPYPLFDVYSTGAWLDNIPLSRSVTYKNLSAFKWEQASALSVASLLVLLNDSAYYQKRNPAISRLIVEHVKNLLLDWQSSDKDLFSRIFPHEYHHLQEILDDNKTFV